MSLHENAGTIPRSKPLALAGIALMTFPLLGSLSTVAAMLRAFATLKTQGAADPSELAGSISMALLSTLYGLGFGLVGAIFVNIALFRNLNREVWFYRSGTVLSLVWCVLLFPLGLIPGLILFFSFRNRRSEFGA